MKQAFLILLGLCAVLTQSCVSIDDKPYPSEVAGSYTQVKSGDTVGKIAAIYHVSADEIMEMNGIDDGRRLKVGQWLFVPNLDPISATIAKVKKPGAPSKKPTAKVQPTASKQTLTFPVPGGKIFRTFSRNKLHPYDGIGIQAKFGSPVIAAYDGKVLFVGDDGTQFGLVVLMEHDDNLITVYTHLAKSQITAGQTVKQSTPIGLVGQSGGVKSPQLHFQVRLNARVQDPQLYLKKP